MKLKCTKCGFVWLPRTENKIKECPRCQKPQLFQELLINGDVE